MDLSKEILTKPQDNEVEVCLFGPGYGESIVIHIPEIGWGIIDSCVVRIENKYIIPPLEYLLQILPEPYPPLAFILLTHPHEDHYMGIDHIIKKYPGGINKICRYNGDGIPELQTYIAQQKIGNNNVLPGFVQIFNAMEEAVRSGVMERRLGEMTYIVDRTAINITGYGQTDIKLIALSPSAASVKNYVRKLLELYPINGMPIRPGDGGIHNMLSVALLLKIGNLQLIFGSDLETGNQNDAGWKAVLNEDNNDLWANLIKVAHHGSENGHYPAIWDKHISRGKPFAIVTPFKKGKNALPTKDDLHRIKNVSKRLGLTSPITTTNELTKYYSRDIIKAILLRTKKIEVIQPTDKIGLIRCRFLLDGTLTEETSVPPSIWL